MILKNSNKKRKGLSPVVATVLLIGISVSLVAVILGIVRPFAEDRLDESKRCYDVLGEVKFNYEYTCYNASNDTMIISISQGDVELDGMIVVFTEVNGTYSDTFTLNNIDGDEYKIPGAESGRRYYFYDITNIPSHIGVAPIVDGKPCDVSDETYHINTCIQ
jgi:flagellin-like protein